ncbi:hypothetical protein QC761_303255 [Podospora bellae-mahoneyi]|uniref:Secreted protein n=1 Tax=Podospora bellae-mahoneyi TaxID=2093777 RepID=A0ABR0FKB8_9PEZI|nr:hypothetical protein QC761_303255 [Podospora bellae-mahoneyi]
MSWLPAAFFAACAAAVEWRWRPFGAPQPWDGDSFTPLSRPALFCSNSSDHLSAHWQARSVIFIGLHSILIPEGHGGVPFLRVTFANVAKRPPLLVELRRASFSLLQQSCHGYLDSRATSRFFHSDLLTARSRRALPLAANLTFPIASYSCNNAQLSAGR